MTGAPISLLELDRLVGGTRRLGPVRRFLLGGRTARDVGLEYDRAVEHALAGTGATRWLWSVVARHHARTVRRLGSD